MARPLNEIEQELLSLPEAERARLAHRLIESLDQHLPADPGIEAAWLEEVKRRDTEIDQGAVTPVSIEQALGRAYDALKDKK